MIKRSESIQASTSSDPQPSRASRKRAKRSLASRGMRKRTLMLEGLEQRQLMAADIPTIPLGSLPTFDAPRNIGTVASFSYVEKEAITSLGNNDFYTDAEIIPLGNQPGQRNTIDISGTFNFGTRPPLGGGFNTDVDVYGFDLKAGDILDIATQGSAIEYTVYYDNGRIWYGVDDLQSTGVPANSPIQTIGNATFAQVIPEDGRYYVEVAANVGAPDYKIGMRTYRPTSEKLPIGAQQVIFVDFDGGTLTPDQYSDSLGGVNGVPIGGIIRYPSLRDSLPDIGIEILNDAAYNRLVADTMAQVKQHFADIGLTGTNGDYANTGVPGDYGVTIVSSETHNDPGSNPLVTRIIVGGTTADFGLPSPIATAIDLGNFDLTSIGVVQLDAINGFAAQFPISNAVSQLDAIARQLAVTISHEASHTFGLRHTDGTNLVGNLIDEGGPIQAEEFFAGVGNDGIFGTTDDTRIAFTTDRFSRTEGLFGSQRSAETLSHVLSTGTVGGSITGRVFNDLNRDGNGAADGGLAGVTVFLDANGNGVLDSSETRAVTGADGSYSLPAATGTQTVVAIAPSIQFVASTATSKPVTTTGATVGGINFGFTKVQSDITGTKFSDNDGDGFRDPGEPGIPGVYIYLDLDGDDRPDLGEPNAITRADGSYTINFPGPGTYTIREVVQAGFVQTFPAGGEWTVVFDGSAVFDKDFGNLPSRDFGDAPNTYLTTEAVGGAAHGITTGLTIGALVDRELDGQPSVAADGDDNNGADDEDGVRQATPFGLGSTGQFAVTVTNTTGSPAYLQGFVDFDGDGTFNGTNERLTEVLIPSGVTGATQTINAAVPSNAIIGSTYARFRLSQTQGLGPGGFAETGEVEDIRVSILPTNSVANDDLNLQVSRNSAPVRLNVLANDFETAENPLTIVSFNNNGTNGSVRIADDDGGRSIFYTPQNGFTGRDVFTYTVSDVFNNLYTATVIVEVTFQSNVPIAIDDIFSIPQGSQNRALNVLDNDVASLSGGLSIASVTPGSAGGTVTIIGGGQSLRYTPASNFAGTEQFTYSVQDGAGSSSSAQVTINLLPGSQADDLVEYSIEFLDPVNKTPITNLQLNTSNPAANRFSVRVLVDELDLAGTRDPEGVVSSFLDLLYTDELVKTVASSANPAFPFDISFGPLFSGATFQQGNAQKPGLIDDVGGVQIVNNPTPFTGKAELFTITFEALSPGIAVFAADPADDARSETVLLGQDVALTPSQIRFGRNEFVIFAGDGTFVSAVDDAFMQGVDSVGSTISASSPTAARLNVLNNDQFVGKQLQEFGVVVQPQNGTITVNNNNTPSDLNDDYFNYRPTNNPTASGFDQFTYVIVTNEGIRSTAQVTLAYGNANADDEVRIGLNLVNAGGQPISSSQIRVGDRFGVQVDLEDLRSNSTFVFAGFLDMLYDSASIRPANTNLADRYNFDVTFAANYNASAGVGTASRLGIIDEFGTVTTQTNATDSNFPSLNPGRMATVFFDAIAPGSSIIAASPADASIAQATLLFRENAPVPVSQIRYEALNITVGSSGQGESPLQNTRLPADVNNDGQVTPIDALHVINEMARFLPSAAEGEMVLSSPFYVDVNGDRAVTALDALQVINELSRRVQPVGNSGEGEAQPVATALLPNAVTTGDVEPVSDSVFAEMSNADARVVSVDAPTNSQTASVAIAGDFASDDKDDDVLDLLADDLAGLLS